MASAAKKIRKLSVDQDMTIYTAMEIKAKFMDMLKKDFEVELDLSRVAEIDTAGLQLLIMAKREFQSSGGNLYLVNHSQAVYEVLDMCNMIQFFGDSIVLPSRQAASRSK
jgi:anti-sigma B factor antagonist